MLRKNTLELINRQEQFNARLLLGLDLLLITRDHIKRDLAEMDVD